MHACIKERCIIAARRSRVTARKRARGAAAAAHLQLRGVSMSDRTATPPLLSLRRGTPPLRRKSNSRGQKSAPRKYIPPSVSTCPLARKSAFDTVLQCTDDVTPVMYAVPATAVFLCIRPTRDAMSRNRHHHRVILVLLLGQINRHHADEAMQEEGGGGGRSASHTRSVVCTLAASVGPARWPREAANSARTTRSTCTSHCRGGARSTA